MRSETHFLEERFWEFVEVNLKDIEKTLLKNFTSFVKTTAPTNVPHEKTSPAVNRKSTSIGYLLHGEENFWLGIGKKYKPSITKVFRHKVIL